MSAWPYPRGRTPRPLAQDRSSEAEIVATEEQRSTTPQCKHCGSLNVRGNGSYLSKRWDERRQAVLCRDCRRSCYLSLGQHLPPKPAPVASTEQFVTANDARPACPFCSGTSIRRRGLIRTRSGQTTQRWYCGRCERRFVSAAHRVAAMDRRRISHWESDDAQAEASFLHIAVQNGAVDVTTIRETIAVNESDLRILDLLIREGALDRHEVEMALSFRGRVLEIFEGLAGLERNA